MMTCGALWRISAAGKGKKLYLFTALAILFFLAGVFALPGVSIAGHIGAGDIVEVYNASGGLNVRSPDACGSSVALKNNGSQGMVLSGPVSCDGYWRYKIRWSDGLEGWSAENWLMKIAVTPSIKFSAGNKVKVTTTSLNVRTAPPELALNVTVSNGATGTVAGGPFYGVPQGSSGFFHFWNINYDGGQSGWSAENYLEKTATPPLVQPPAVSTQPASNITSISAVLSGNLDSTGGETSQVWFEYGLTQSYGQFTYQQSQSSAGSFNQSISGLQLNTTYNFRACASNSTGSACGSNSSFTTTTAPNQTPSLPTNPNQFKSDGATPISESGMTIEDNVIFKATVSDPDGDTVKLQIEVKEFSQSFNGQGLLESGLVGSGSVVSLTKSGLVESQYKWRARVMDSKGAVSGWLEFGAAGNVDFEVRLETIPNEFWIEVKTDGECIYQEQSPPLVTKLKCYPAGWVLKVPNPQNKPWSNMSTTIQVVDVTDNVTGWISKGFLNYNPSQQDNWKEKTELKDPSQGETKPAILEAVNRYYNNTNFSPSLYSSNDDQNCLSIFKFRDFRFTRDLRKGDSNCDVRYLQIILRNEPSYQKGGSTIEIYPEGKITGFFGDLTEAAVKRFQEKYRISQTGIIDSQTRGKLNTILGNWPSDQSFPMELILAIAAQESGLIDFDNEIVALTPWGRGIMQIDSDDYVGLGSGVQWYKDGNVNYCRGDKQACKHYYTNTSQGIYSNIKDGLRNLQDKYNRPYLEQHYNECISGNLGWSIPNGISCDEMRWISSVQRYNGYNDGNPSKYLAKYNYNKDGELVLVNGIAYHLRNLEGTFDYDNNADLANKIEKIKATGVKIFSPVELQVYDSERRITGIIEGEAKEEIPFSFYDEDNETVWFPDISNSYRYEIVGTDEGTYGLSIETANEGEIIVFNSTDIPTTASTTHQYTIDWEAVSQGEKGVTVLVDYEGDGIFDKSATADNELTAEEFVLQTETIAAVLDFDPDTLNICSQGRYVTTYIELPGGYGFDVNNIDISSVKLNGVVPALPEPVKVTDKDDNGLPELAVKFDRSEVHNILPIGDNVKVEITGLVLHDGLLLDFKDDDVIKVIQPVACGGGGGWTPPPPPPPAPEPAVTIDATIDFTPKTLNLDSQGQFVTVYIELPDRYDVSQIDLASILLNDSVFALSRPTEVADYDEDGIQDLMVKFDREQVQSVLEPGDNVEIKVIGRVYHTDTHLDFRGYDTIAVIQPPSQEEEATSQPEEEDNEENDEGGVSQQVESGDEDNGVSEEESGEIGDGADEADVENTDDSTEIEEETNGGDNTDNEQ